MHIWWAVPFAEAAPASATAYKILTAIKVYIINPAIILAIAVAVVIFVYGLIEFLARQDSDEAKTKGRQHMIWGLVGLFVMVGVFGIMQIIINTLGVTLPPEAQLPSS